MNRVATKNGLTSAVLEKRHGPVLLGQVRGLETVLVLEPSERRLDRLTGALNLRPSRLHHDDGQEENRPDGHLPGPSPRHDPSRETLLMFTS